MWPRDRLNAHRRTALLASTDDVRPTTTRRIRENRMNMEGAARTATLRTAPVIEVSRLEKLFVTVRNARIHALHDISFAVGEREFVTIVGPSGCGKSTLLKLIAGLLPASAGRIAV